MELDTGYYNSHWQLSEILIGFTFCYYKYLQYLFKNSLLTETFNAFWNALFILLVTYYFNYIST